MTKQFIFLTALVFLITITSWSLFKFNHTKPAPIPPKQEKQIDAFAEDVSAIRYDTDGKIASEFYAPRLVHYANIDTTVFEKPNIILFQNQQNPWNITAKTGDAKKGFDLLHLQNDVRLHQKGGKNNNDVTITTSSLNFDTKTQIASTSEPVTLYQKGNDGSVTIIKSVGMKVNQKTGEVTLLSKANGYYAPPNVPNKK